MDPSTADSAGMTRLSSGASDSTLVQNNGQIAPTNAVESLPENLQQEQELASSSRSPASDDLTLQGELGQYVNGKKTKRSRWICFASHHPWITCFVAWFVSLMLTALIIILLAYFNGKLYEDWHSAVTLNAMVSILVTLLYIILMLPITTCIAQLKWNHFHKARQLYDVEVFDGATQSAWGGLRFLLARPKSLLGTVAVVMALIVTIIGPFFQQVISFKYNSFVVGDAYLPTTTIWGIWRHSSNVSSTSQQLHAELLGATLALPNASFDVTTTAQLAGNASWETYQTLAVQGECRDVTYLLRSWPRCNASREDEHQFQCSLATSALWSLPNAVTFPGPTVNSLLVSSSTDRSLAFQDRGLILTDFFILSQSFEMVTISKDNAVWRGSAIAIECILQIVTETLRATYVNGVLHEERLQAPTQHNSAAAIMNAPVRLGIAAYSQYQFQNSCLDLSSSSSPGPLFYCGNTSSRADDELVTLVPTILNDSRILNSFSYKPSDQPRSQVSKFQQVIVNMAAAMTRRLRMTVFSREDWCMFRSFGQDNGSCTANDTYFSAYFGDKTPTSAASGQLIVDKITYSIQWSWIAIPASLLVGVVLLVVATIVDTKQKKMPIFGNSGLATMIHGVDEESRIRLLSYQAVDDMEEAARHTIVRFDSSRQLLVNDTSGRRTSQQGDDGSAARSSNDTENP